MATLTIQNVPENLVERIQSAADHNRRSMEQELRALIESRFAGKEPRTVRSDESKDEALRRIRERWKDLPETTPEEVDRWRKEGRR
jgi:plasmid stability protein